MKILMISAGLEPKRYGGLVAYAQELIEELIRRGHEIVYLDMNGFSLWPFSYLTTDHHAGYKRHALFNSGILADASRGTKQPLKEVYPSFRVKSLILKVLKLEKPDVIHFQELIAFPAALLETMRGQKYKMIFTAQDYYALCPTVKLFKHDGQICRLGNDDLECKVCCQEALHSWKDRFNKMLTSFYKRFRAGYRIYVYLTGRGWLSDFISRFAGPPKKYTQRRYAFIQYLSLFHVVICMSKLHYNVMARVLGNAANLRQMYLTRKTFAKKPVKSLDSKKLSGRIIFTALNVNMPAKGLNLLTEVFAGVQERYQNVELRLYGTQGVNTDHMKYFEKYQKEDLDAMVRESDFGIVPSLWEEAFAYVGPEMLSRGLPLIVSSRGAMAEYVTDGVDGFIFDPDQKGSLDRIVESLLESEDLRNRIARSALDSCHKFIDFDRHVSQMEELYHEICSNEKIRV